MEIDSDWNISLGRRTLIPLPSLTPGLFALPSWVLAPYVFVNIPGSQGPNPGSEMLMCS